MTRRILAAALGLAIIAMAVFGIRFVRHFDDFRSGDLPPERIEPWMTPRFVVRSHHLDRDAFVDALGLDRETGRATLEEIAVARGQSFDDFRADLDAAIEAARADRR